MASMEKEELVSLCVRARLSARTVEQTEMGARSMAAGELSSCDMRTAHSIATQCRAAPGTPHALAAPLRRACVQEKKQRAALAPWKLVIGTHDAETTAAIKIQRAFRLMRARCNAAKVWPSDENHMHWK